jgi:hypothetical protein
MLVAVVAMTWLLKVVGLYYIRPVLAREGAHELAVDLGRDGVDIDPLPGEKLPPTAGPV